MPKLDKKELDSNTKPQKCLYTKADIHEKFVDHFFKPVQQQDKILKSPPPQTVFPTQ